jgi:hypothetical protein
MEDGKNRIRENPKGGSLGAECSRGVLSCSTFDLSLVLGAFAGSGFAGSGTDQMRGPF